MWLIVLSVWVAVPSVSAPADGRYGWKTVREITTELTSENTDLFLLSTDYRIGSLWAFHIKNKNVDVLAYRKSQFTLWFDEDSKIGKDALILAHDTAPLGSFIVERFDTVEQVRSANVDSAGRSIAEYRFYIGRNYRADRCITTLIPLSSPETGEGIGYRAGCARKITG